MMTLKCAWCGAIMRQGDEEFVSHGICPDCLKREKEILKHAGVLLQQAAGDIK